MLHYEVTVVMSPGLTEQQATEAVKKHADIIKKDSAKRKASKVKVYYCSLKRLAYLMDNNKQGHYCVMHIDLDTSDVSVLKELDTLLKHDTNVLRHLIIKAESLSEESLAPLMSAESYWDIINKNENYKTQQRQQRYSQRSMSSSDADPVEGANAENLEVHKNASNEQGVEDNKAEKSA